MRELKYEDVVTALSVHTADFSGFSLSLDEKLQTQDAELIAECLKLSSSSSLQILKLGGNNIGDEGLIAICSSLTHHICEVRLKELDIEQNNITEIGILHLCSMMIMNSSPICKLSKLFLSRNNIGDNGAEELCNTLTNNRSVDTLFLREINIRMRGIRAFCKLLETSTCCISSISLSDNEIGDNEMEYLINALYVNRSLKRLFLRNCKFSDKSAFKLLALLRVNTTILEINILKNNVSRELSMKISNIKSRNFTIFEMMCVILKSSKEPFPKYIRDYERTEINKSMNDLSYYLISNVSFNSTIEVFKWKIAFVLFASSEIFENGQRSK